jgi:hypothetical protein
MNLQKFASFAVQKLLNLKTAPTLPDVNGWWDGFEIKLGQTICRFSVDDVGNRKHIFLSIPLQPINPYWVGNDKINEYDTLYLSIFDGYWEPDQKNATSVKAYIWGEKRRYRGRTWTEFEKKVIPYTYVFEGDYESLLNKVEIDWGHQKRKPAEY